MTIGPLYALTTFTITNDLRFRGIRHRHRAEKKKKELDFFYSSFSSTIDLRASAVSITRIFIIFRAAAPPYH